MLPSDIRNKMERKVDEKLDSLEKYLPFINYLLQLDKNKYKKFMDIQHWITSRKRYPMNVLQKIEQSIITQYRNLFYDDGKVPKHIMDIFNTHAHAKCFRVNLCSDDEDTGNSCDIEEDDDDVIIVSSSPQSETANLCAKGKSPETTSALQCGKCKEQEATAKPALNHYIMDEPICIDSDDDEILDSTVLVEDELCLSDEQLFKRRGDFLDKVEVEEEESEGDSEAIKRVTSIDKQNGGVEVVDLQRRESDLDNMDLDKLKQICEDLTKESGFDMEQLLKSIKLISMQKEANRNKSPHDDLQSSPINSNSSITLTPYPDFLYSKQIETNKNKSPHDDFQSSPIYSNSNAPVTPYPEVYANVIRPNVYNLPPQVPPRLNLKDPRIVKLLERSKTLHMISMGMPLRNVNSTTELPISQPTTYGEYKRLKEEKAKKTELKRIEEAKKSEELKGIEKAKRAEELRLQEAVELKRVEEAKRAEELRRIEEAKRVEESKKQEEAKRMEAAERDEELKRIDEAKRTEMKTIEESKKSEDLRRIDELKIAEKLRMEKTKHAEKLEKSRKNNKRDKVKNVEDTIIADKTKREINAGIVRKLKDLQTGSKRKFNDLDNNTTSSKENGDEVSYQGTEICSTVSALKEGTTDLRSIILNTILPYSDKILNVLRKENDLQELKDKITSLNNSNKVVEEKPATNPSPVSQQILSVAYAAVNGSDQNANSVKNFQNDTKCMLNLKKSQESRKRLQKEKKPKTKPTYKRIRSISSSSSTTSELSSMSSATSVPLAKRRGKFESLVSEPVIKLRRLSEETILKYTKTSLVSECKTINVRLVEDVKKTNKTVHHLVKEKPTKLNVKYKNIDTQMTNDNTKFCVLCKSKPSDLTNHYKRVHKTESYVARLSRSALHYLENNIPFAQKLGKGTNPQKYLVKCGFCQDNIEDKFINVYKHFSIHTGEYAFQCDNCKLEKPYEFDIQSHKCHAKSCRNAPIRTLYQYPPNVLVIYLYCCKICNFVQLNEANTFKHLRDHHEKRQDDSSCIKRYILTAIKDAETCEESPESVTNYELLMKDVDEDIVVKNEAILEDVNDFHKVQRGKVEANGSTLLLGRHPDFESTLSNNLVMVELPYTKYTKYSSILNKNIDSLTASQQNDARPTVLSSLENLKNSSVASGLEYIKTEFCDIEPIEKENYSCQKVLRNSSNILYRQYTNGVSYFGLYKCMATDCLFSTNANEEILQHLQEHLSSECPPEGCLLCAYCQLDAEICATPEMLIEHIQKHHHQSQFQCSVCCYRAISPSHVSLHFKQAHPEQELQFVYQCALDISLDTNVPSNIDELMKENVEPLICPLIDCVRSFHSVIWMKNHLMHAHSLPIKSECITALEPYTCIYCTLNFYHLEEVKNHLVVCHPDKQPYVCERILLPEKEEDLLQNLKVTLVSLPIIPSENIRHVNVKQEIDISDNANNVPAANQMECDSKPNLEQLVQTAEESVKFSLLKLVGNTGISSNLLYHCPEPTCGGLFSSYDLWHRHMSLRHCCILSVCPHCVNIKTELPLADFKEHFLQHCCHLNGCFHCGETFSSEQAARDHITLAHIDINPDTSAIKMEKVPLYFNQSFNILLKSEQDKDRYTFLLEFQEVVQNRCKFVDKLHYDSLKTQWIVPCTATWLENFPSFKSNERAKRKCFCQNCPYQTYDNEMFYAHLRESHQVRDSKFACAKCDFRVACTNWEPVIDHIKMHVLNIHICSVCSYYHYDRKKIRQHLAEEHRFRDVPIVTIIRSSVNTQISLVNVFAQQRKTFSTIKSCFCCDRSSDSWQAFAIHLRKVHLLTLQYFCEICDESLRLTDCDAHFTNCHPTAALRIRGQIATNNQISIDGIMPLKLTIESNGDSRGAAKIIKQESCDMDTDDDIELINDEDIIIANDVKMCATKQNPNDIRCVNVENLQSQHTNIGSFEAPMLPQPLPPIAVQFPQMQPQLQLRSQFIPQFAPPMRNIGPSATNAVLVAPHIAIHSQISNFADDCNYRQVNILVNTTGNSPNNNYPIQNFPP